jgi:hypothetical protein
MKTEIGDMHVEGFGKLHERRYGLEGPMTLREARGRDQ